MSTPDAAPEQTPAQRLALICAGLGAADQRTLLAFAEFLAAGGRTAPVPALAHGLNPEPNPESDPERNATALRHPTPLQLPRPEQETVIAAIRRLTLTYAMLDHAAMLHETAALMSAHVLHGRSPAAVIDDLEALFRRHYQDYCRAAQAARAGPPGHPDDAPRGQD